MIATHENVEISFFSTFGIPPRGSDLDRGAEPGFRSFTSHSENYPFTPAFLLFTFEAHQGTPSRVTDMPPESVKQRPDRLTSVSTLSSASITHNNILTREAGGVDRSPGSKCAGSPWSRGRRLSSRRANRIRQRTQQTRPGGYAALTVPGAQRDDAI
jgi:hypothetical protein